MIWPRLSLTGKLFVAVVVPVLLAVGLMAVALDYSTRQGFTRYLLESELTGLEGLSEALKDRSARRARLARHHQLPGLDWIDPPLCSRTAGTSLAST